MLFVPVLAILFVPVLAILLDVAYAFPSSPVSRDPLVDRYIGNEGNALYHLKQVWPNGGF